MVELLIELFGELLLQGIAEVLAEFGLRTFGESIRRPRNPWLAAVGYAAFGAIAGGLSLLVFANHLVPAGPWRIVNLIATPPAVGAMMAALGTWRAKRGEPVLRIDRFSFGVLFAFAFALVRYYFAAP